MSWKPVEYKFVLLGDSSVGKSAIFLRLSGKPFSENTTSTIGTDKIAINYDDVEVETNKTKNFKITLFDTAGQERYRSITKTYFKDSQGIILIYSIIDPTSFEHVQIWLESIKESLSDWKRSGYIVMLLGNKLDIVEKNEHEREVLIEEAEKLCKDQDIYWGGEFSAKTFDDERIKEIFEKFMKAVYLKLIEDDDNNKRQKAKTLCDAEALQKKKKRNNCCYKIEP